MKRHKSKNNLARYSKLFCAAFLILFVSACGEENIAERAEREEEERIENALDACIEDDIPLEECDF